MLDFFYFDFCSADYINMRGHVKSGEKAFFRNEIRGWAYECR
jgi:hypothetical protein